MTKTVPSRPARISWEELRAGCRRGGKLPGSADQARQSGLAADPHQLAGVLGYAADCERASRGVSVIYQLVRKLGGRRPGHLYDQSRSRGDLIEIVRAGGASGRTRLRSLALDCGR
jgi:hypothetical protein